jgi:hypothetical protein
MPDDFGQTVGFIMSKVDEAREHGVSNFRANLVVDLATLTLLIDAKVITLEGAIQRIEKILRGQIPGVNWMLKETQSISDFGDADPASCEVALREIIPPMQRLYRLVDRRYR